MVLEKVESWANEMDSAMVVVHTEMTLMKYFDSSTWVNGHSLQQLLSLASGS